MFNSIFGQAAGNTAINTYLSNPAQGMANQMGTGLAQQQNTYSNALQQSQLYNQMLNQRTARWMIDGEVCSGVKDFARRLFPEDEQSQMMLILKYGE